MTNILPSAGRKVLFDMQGGIPDGLEGVRAFLEKRSPRYQG